MKKELITETARSLWAAYQERDPRRLCEYLDVAIEELPMGLEADSIKGLVVRNSRCYCIVVNSDLTPVQQDFTIFHEVGHIVLKHAEQVPCTCRSLFSTKETSVQENEANEFIAEYLMDTEETMTALRDTDDFFDAARILHVPPAIMDFKWRMLTYYKLLTRECPIYTDSDCMAHLDCGNAWEYENLN